MHLENIVIIELEEIFFCSIKSHDASVESHSFLDYMKFLVFCFFTHPVTMNDLFTGNHSLSKCFEKYVPAEQTV